MSTFHRTSERDFNHFLDVLEVIPRAQFGEHAGLPDVHQHQVPPALADELLRTSPGWRLTQWPGHDYSGAYSSLDKTLDSGVAVTLFVEGVLDAPAMHPDCRRIRDERAAARAVLAGAA